MKYQINMMVLHVGHAFKLGEMQEESVENLPLSKLPDTIVWMNLSWIQNTEVGHFLMVNVIQCMHSN